MERVNHKIETIVGQSVAAQQQCIHLLENRIERKLAGLVHSVFWESYTVRIDTKSLIVPTKAIEAWGNEFHVFFPVILE